jgi:hypothetical protein
MPYGRLARVKGLPAAIGIGQGTILIIRSVPGGEMCRVSVQILPAYGYASDVYCLVGAFMFADTPRTNS